MFFVGIYSLLISLVICSIVGYTFSDFMKELSSK